MATYSFNATERGTLECDWFYTGTVEADSLEEARQKAREKVERGELNAYDSRSGDTVESSLADEDLGVSPVTGASDEEPELGTYPEHRNDIGDWCPWSGEKRKPGHEDICPARCRASGSGDDDEEDDEDEDDEDEDEELTWRD